MAIVQSLVTLPQCYNTQDFDWSVLPHSALSLAQAVQQPALFEWLFIYLSCFRTIGLTLSLCIRSLRFNAIFCRNSVHATMARSETLGQEPHEEERSAEWGLLVSQVPCPLVSLIIRYYHNNDPGHWGAPRWDGTCWDQWDTIGQV